MCKTILNMYNFNSLPLGTYLNKKKLFTSYYMFFDFGSFSKCPALTVFGNFDLHYWSSWNRMGTDLHCRILQI